MRKILTIAALLFSLPGFGQMQMLFSSDSLVGITSPLAIDSLFYWFAADQGVLDSLGGAIATDEGVGTWQDLSGNGRHVTQTTNTDRPVYKATGGPGGKPCLQFDGSDDFLASAAHFWGSDDITVIVVMKFANATRDANEVFMSRMNTASNERQFYFFGKTAANSYVLEFNAFKDGTTANYTYHTGSSKSTSFRILSVVNNSGYTLRIDGSSVSLTKTIIGTGDDTIFNATASTAIGCFNALAPSGFFQGSISEIMVWTRPLTAAELAAMHNYCNLKYDLY